GPVVVLGHSFGGRVAIHIAATHPDRVKALVLTGVPQLVRTAGRPKRSAMAFRLARLAHRRGLVSDDRMNRIRHRYGSID
ncbi:MAG: alpha/beta fold hydrolase, partial [Acidimicrobiales bacterium]